MISTRLKSHCVCLVFPGLGYKRETELGSSGYLLSHCSWVVFKDKAAKRRKKKKKGEKEESFSFSSSSSVGAIHSKLNQQTQNAYCTAYSVIVGEEKVS